MRPDLPCLFVPLILALMGAHPAHAQTTQFTYQGILEADGVPVTGLYDFRVTFYETPSGNASALGQTFPVTTNVERGLFTLPIDLGLPLWMQCSNRWMEIEVKTNGAVAWQTLAPRTLVTPTPYAMGAYTACRVADNGVTGQMIAGGQVVKSLNGLTDLVTLSPGANISFTTNGNTIQISAPGGGGTGWLLNGNNGTAPGVNFLGTTDNQALELKVNNTRALRIEPTGGAPTIMGGYYQNWAGGPGGVVAGGGTSGSINEAAGMYAFVGAGHGSKAGPFSAVVGGAYNVSLSQFSFIGSGLGNTNQGDFCFIGSGTNNLIQGGSDGSAIGGGLINQIQGNSVFATIAGGDQNRIGANAGAATIAGGFVNTIESGAGSSCIAGGNGNRIQSGAVYSAIGGGDYNTNSAAHSLIGGGSRNLIQAPYATVSGGQDNRLEGLSSASAIGGGAANAIQNSYWAFVGGGTSNVIQSWADRSTIGGGGNNTIIGSWTLPVFDTIGGGGGNAILTNSTYATISGGAYNTIQATASFSTIGGGLDNVIQTNAPNAIIGGGHDNTIASAAHSTIGGGGFNLIQLDAYDSSIGGGGYNTIQTGAHSSAIGGGNANTASGIAATIPGGNANVASGDASLAAGSYSTASGFISTAIGEGVLASGHAAVALGSFSAAANQFSMAAGRKAKANHSGSFVWADSQDADFNSTANDQFSVRAAGGMRLNTDTSMFFGFQTRQMLNLWGTAYGLGVQPNTLYFRADNASADCGFVWFKGGSHAEGIKDPGPGGQTLMALDDRALFVYRDVNWSLGGALVDNQGGSVELGPKFDTTSKTPFIDFHFGSGFIEDYNVRLINDHDRELAIWRSSPDRISGAEMARFSASGLAVNGTFVSASDRNLKAGFEPVDSRAILEKVAALPITRWHYTNDLATPHLGPMAQEFHAAFHLGPDDKHITTVDADGVALAAIQGLYQQLREKDATISSLERRLERLEQMLSANPNQGPH